jgi:Fe-S-cluster containining protein
MPQSFPIDLTTHLGPLRQDMLLPEAPIRLAEFVRLLFPVAEVMTVQAVAAATSDGEAKITCGPGCGACCRQAVPISIPEAFLLHDITAALPLEKRSDVLRRFESIQLRLREAHIAIDLQPGETQDSRWARLGMPYFFLNMPCPFLEAESCSIHEQRPTVCREFLVTSPAKECDDLTSDNTYCIDIPFSLPHSLSRLASVMLDVEPQLMPMPVALAWVEAHPEWNNQRFDAALLYSTWTDMVQFLLRKRQRAD